jgi:hypothetical protein
MGNGKNVIVDQHRIISYLEGRMGVRATKSVGTKLSGETAQRDVLLDDFFRLSLHNHLPLLKYSSSIC